MYKKAEAKKDDSSDYATEKVAANRKHDHPTKEPKAKKSVGFALLPPFQFVFVAW
ncbi:hypothetical protein MFFC18_21380 [Mariniblastus fucicola]|uniref:Uncharacterized protein n=1 Tax=Mariniblastus fucicola TaxID=980251 RepID=A0A5B9PBF1_9BACT|nr:hypothetical protein MFFC18_21380 [Mariniblastus fucicola]